MRFSCGPLVACSGTTVVFRGEPGIGSGVLGKELVILLELPGLVPRLRAVLGSSASCPMLVVSCLAVLLLPLLDGGPGVQA